MMIMVLPRNLEVKLVDEIITALANYRYETKDYEELLEPASAIYIGGKYQSYPKTNYDKSRYYFVKSEYVTLEIIEVIEDIKKLLPIEIYFEAGERGENEVRGEIYDNAIYSLYLEKPHERMKTA